MSIAIVYFSGTYSTAFCAQRLSHYLSNIPFAGSSSDAGKNTSPSLISIDLSDVGNDAEIFRPANGPTPPDCMLLILMFPAHAAGAPEPIARWIANLNSVQEPIRCAVLSVSGGGAIWPNNDCRRRVIRQLERKGYAVDFEDMLIMPSNWTIPTPAELIPLLYRATDTKISHIATEIASGVRRRSKIAVGSAMISWIAGMEQANAGKFGRRIRVSDACTSCGWCAKNCPRGNISMDIGAKPVFGDTCVICMRCFYGCPADALTPGYLPAFKIKMGFSLKPAAARQLEQGKLGTWDSRDKKTRTLIEENARGILWSAVRRYLYAWLAPENQRSASGTTSLPSGPV